MSERKIETIKVKGNTLFDLEKAVKDLLTACRSTEWGGKSATLVESADGFTPHSFELVEETLSDGGKALKVRVLFVGDV